MKSSYINRSKVSTKLTSNDYLISDYMIVSYSEEKDCCGLEGIK